MNTPIPLDFAHTWQTYTQHNMRERLSNDKEIDFWSRNALGYDAGTQTQSDSYRETLNAIQGLLQPHDTLLDVGSGSGRYALPLARHVRCITALDLSPDMLAILRGKCQQQAINNSEIVEATWEDAVVEPHDVVMAAWSMYRQRDILTNLQKLIDATKRVLIIVDGDDAARPDYDPVHERLRTEVWGVCENYLYFVGMLCQLRIRADLRVVYEQYDQTAESVLVLTQSFAPQDASTASVEQYAHLLTPYTQQTDKGVIYTCRFAVGVVIWQRHQGAADGA